MKTLADTIEAMNALRQFVGPAQFWLLGTIAGRSEEREFFRAKVCELAATVAAMPHTYQNQTDGQGDAAIAHLHYFAGGQASWYITEKDANQDGAGQVQAFGLADLFGDGGEVGYISIVELLGAAAELDLYWRPKSLAEIRGKVAVAA